MMKKNNAVDSETIAHLSQLLEKESEKVTELKDELK
jgi:hypothetical protein